MAAPQKQGMEYFSYDVDLDQDDKLGMIIAEFDHKGELAFTKLCCWIYKNEGYYTEWTEEVQLKFMRRYKYCGFSLSFLVKELVPRCIKWGLFDKTVFDSFQILTSARIQKTWVTATHRRIGRFYVPKYWLIPVNADMMPVITELTQSITDKVNKSKVNESKVDMANELPTVPIISITEPVKTEPERKKNAGAAKFIPPTLQEAKDFFVKIMGNARKPSHWPVDKCHNQAGKFHDHYQANGWKQGRGKAIIDWEAAARNFMRNEIEGVFSSNNSPVAQKQNPPDQKPVFLKVETEINYLYERFFEDASKVTIISIDPLHYDHLKKLGLINFDPEKVAAIRNEAIQHLKDLAIPVTDPTTVKYMKKIGVIEFFKQWQMQKKEVVFCL